MNKSYFTSSDGSISTKCLKYYNEIKNYAKRNNLKDTFVALDLAAKLHCGQFRDGGLPYVIHPLEITAYLILLNVQNAIFEMNLSKLHNENLAKQQTTLDLDILLSASLLHDALEDCIEKLPKKGTEFITEYQLHPDIFKYVDILTKHKEHTDYSLSAYYKEICNYWQTALIKIADRANNCSTIDVFSKTRKEKYIKETKQYLYDMASIGRQLYPDFSRIFTIMKYLIVSICETVASSLNLKNFITKTDYDKTFFFIKGFAIGKGSMQNTFKALPLASKYYESLKRKSGDAFIIHPLRVCSYLISLKIDDDKICAAALLHEIIKKCNLPYHGIEIVTNYNLDPQVLDYIRVMANVENYPKDLYYEVLKQNPEVMVLKLSNRAHTCTTLMDSSDEEIREYVEECEQYIYPLCEYGINNYPKYANSVEVMQHHISSMCRIAKHSKKDLYPSEDSKK